MVDHQFLLKVFKGQLFQLFTLKYLCKTDTESLLLLVNSNK